MGNELLLRRARSALRMIAGDGCTNFWQGDCKSHGRTKNAKYGADRWCDACIARDGIKRSNKTALDKSHD